MTPAIVRARRALEDLEDTIGPDGASTTAVMNASADVRVAELAIAALVARLRRRAVWLVAQAAAGVDDDGHAPDRETWIAQARQALALSDELAELLELEPAAAVTIGEVTAAAGDAATPADRAIARDALAAHRRALLAAIALLRATEALDLERGVEALGRLLELAGPAPARAWLERERAIVAIVAAGEHWVMATGAVLARPVGPHGPEARALSVAASAAQRRLMDAVVTYRTLTIPPPSSSSSAAAPPELEAPALGRDPFDGE